MNQDHTPLFHALLEHIQQKTSSYHVPGHKNGTVGSAEFLTYFQSVLPFDVTELRGLDDLHYPTGPIAESEQLLADLYHVANSRFLVNGSTAGNLAMILATTRPGDEVYVQRDSHKSIFHGLELAQVKPIIMPSEMDPQTNMVVGVDVEKVKNEMKEHPERKVAIFTYPNYYGMGPFLEDLFTWMHNEGKIILVDEAHGAHFPIHPSFPKSALEMGADVVVQSAHKTLPAMTMGAFLHMQSFYPYRDRIDTFLQMIQTSSPSYPIMASLDYARYYAAHFTNEKINKLVQKRASFLQELKKIPQIQVVYASERFIQDPLKITIQSRTTLTGYGLQQALEQERIYTELADMERVLFVLPLSEEWTGEAIVAALKAIVKDRPVSTKKVPPFIPSMNNTKPFPYCYQQLQQKQVLRIPLKESVGEIAAESIIPYPPGIPFILKGEQIEQEQVKILQTLQQHQAYFQGNDGSEILIYGKE